MICSPIKMLFFSFDESPFTFFQSLFLKEFANNVLSRKFVSGNLDMEDLKILIKLVKFVCLL